MKKIMNKNFIQKIVITILIVLSFNFVMPNFSRAEYGGILLPPVIDLLAGIGDILMVALETAFGDSENVTLGFLTCLADPGDLLKENNTKYLASEGEFSGDANMIIDVNEKIDRGFLGMGSWFGNFGYGIPTIAISPEAIFSNNVPALDANFINPKFDDKDNSVAHVLQKTIASWYVALRNLVIVCLLSVLLYVAIRMIISSTASDKAKYKQMILDWLVALCLLFFLHYIMSFTMSLIDIITESIGESVSNVVICVQDDKFNEYSSSAVNGNKAYFKLNLMGFCRFKVQYSDIPTRLLYFIMYIALVIYTIKFTWEYMKRAIKLAFLTLMAPLVTLTYPIDKMSDGKAQAFNMWLKEYIFTALIQPFHLIIYTIFMTSTMALMSSGSIFSIIYAILFLAFITPAEKLLKKFFRFDEKGGSGGSSFAGGLGGAAAFNAIKGIASKGAAKIGGNQGGNKGGNSGNNVRTKNPVPANNGPDGLSAYASEDNPEQLERNNNRQDNEELEENAQQRMLDSYDEGYGTDEWNPQEREAMSREAYSQNNARMNHNDEEYANLLRESGHEEDEIASMMSNTNEPENIIEQNANNINNQEDAKAENNGFLRRTGKAIKGATTSALKYTGGQLKSRFATKEGWKKNAKLVGRTAARVAGVGLGATLGLAAGITGDDLDDVVKYGVAGATLGGTVLGDGIIGAGRRIANSGVVQAASQGARESYYGGVKEAQATQNERQLKASGELREYIGNNITDKNGQRLSSEELTAYEDRAIAHYNAGITDNSEIKKTLMLENRIRDELKDIPNMEEKEKNDLARQQAETVAKYAEQFNGDKYETNEKYRAEKREEFAAGIRKVNPNLSEKQVKQNSEQMIKRICEYKKITYRKD